MSNVYMLVRFPLFGLLLLTHLLVSLSVIVLCRFQLRRARPLLIRLISLTCRIGLKIYNAKIIVNGKTDLGPENYFFVSNHLSYLDILTISSFFPSCFITSVEMKETPLLGQICQLSGCLFVERRNKRKLSDEVGELTQALDDGMNVVVFPEAKSTNGESLLKFRRPLYQAAINSGKKIIPLCINYRLMGGEKISKENRDEIFWYGSIPFFPHALLLFRKESIVIEFSIFDPIDTKIYSDKLDVVEKTFEIINKHYDPIV